MVKLCQVIGYIGQETRDHLSAHFASGSFQEHIVRALTPRQLPFHKKDQKEKQ